MFGRRISVLAAIGAVACSIVAGNAGATTATLNPIADAAVTAAAPTARLGGAPLLGTVLSPDTRSYLRFDVGHAPAPILSATLSVYAINPGDGFEVRSVGAPPNAWSESRISYSNAPPPGPSTGNDSGPAAAPGWLTVDVTDIVVAAAAAHQPAEFVLVAGGPRPEAYVSREGPRSYAPKLAISNDITPPDITITSPVDLGTSPTAKATIKGIAGTAPGDNPTITVQIFPGEDQTTPIQTITTRARNGTFSVTTSALAPGEYTAAATQSDADGNVTTTYARFFVT